MYTPGLSHADADKELFAVTSQVQFFERLGFATFRREKTAMFLEVGLQKSRTTRCNDRYCIHAVH
jgi:hypothetical protein